MTEITEVLPDRARTEVLHDTAIQPYEFDPGGCLFCVMMAERVRGVEADIDMLIAKEEKGERRSRGPDTYLLFCVAFACVTGGVLAGIALGIRIGTGL